MGSTPQPGPAAHNFDDGGSDVGGIHHYGAADGELGAAGDLADTMEGCWSRRITQEHRIVYRVTDDRIDFLKA